VKETKYLSVENAWRYRSIMRLFYIYDQQFKHWLDKEDVFAELKKQPIFADYTIELCRQDLDGLVDWGNLNAVQDTAKVATYQQFVNKQFRYQITEYAIEIERMTVRLENLFIEGGSLEPTLLERIKDELKRLKTMVAEDERTVGGWWSQLTSDFQRLNQNYQDYLRDWHSAKAEELMKTKSFMLYKEKLVEYLRHFIKELQQYAYEIEMLLRAITEEEKEKLIDKITRYEQSIPRLEMEAIDFEMIQRNVEGKYQSLQQFFLNNQSKESEVEIILTMTNEIIRRITRYATNILEMSNQYSNRKEEYRKMGELFSNCETIEAAHLLSANVFGIEAYKHFCGELTRQTESIYSSVFDEEPCQWTITPRIRNYREKLEKTSIVDHTEIKKKMRETILKQREQEKAVVLSYTATGRIDFKTLGELPASVRNTLLRWLTKAIHTKDGETVTEHGKKVKIINPKEQSRCVLRCEDGDLDMPAYILAFED
jgi:uncharacterized protein (TIGR02677 family)